MAFDAAGNLSAYSNISYGTTTGTADTQPPSAPANLAATASSSTQIGLAWTASTDNVGVTGYRIERCSGASCTAFAQIGTTTGTTSFSDSGLTASTAYRYRVRATDAAGLLSGYSNIASATTSSGADTQPPSAPGNLAATASSSTQIGLTWMASTDNVGVTGYRVERCSGASCTSFAEVGTTGGPSATTFTSSGLSASTAYRFRVRATDAAGLLSGYSNIASATTSSGADTTPPSAPANLAATASSSTQIGLAWTASTDNVGVTGYRIERCSGASCTAFAQIGTTSGRTTSFSDSGLTASTAYRYRVRATDAAGLLSGYSNIASATTSSGADTTPPSAPANLAATASSSTQIGLAWTASTDNVGVTGYRIERCSGASCTAFAQVGTTSGPNATTFTSSGLSASTAYRFRVRATDAAGLLSGYSNIASATTSSGADTTPPSAPANLAATASSSSQIALAWTASTDNVGVTGYRVERCAGSTCTSFAQVGTTSGPNATTFTSSGLIASTAYRFRVRATDAAGLLSGYSNIASATTSSGADTTPPSAPANLAATASSSSQIALAWTASTDNVGVTGYRVERCAGSTCTSFAQVGTTSGPNATTFTSSGLTASTAYRYRVRATDAAGLLSGYSNIASATTSSGADTTPPSAPANLAATASSSTQIGLAWTASTDNVGVTGYRVERCSGASCTSFTQIGTTGATTFSDSGLAASTTYDYRVRANDAAGNLSGYSNIASATTSAGGGGSSIAVSVSPKRGGLVTAQTLSITATLTNDTGNQGVTWSFSSTGSTAGGGFSPTGSTSGNAVTFTAPSAAGVVTITATAVGDNTKTGDGDYWRDGPGGSVDLSQQPVAGRHQPEGIRANHIECGDRDVWQVVFMHGGRGAIRAAALDPQAEHRRRNAQRDHRGEHARYGVCV
jgi:chitodextrinase